MTWPNLFILGAPKCGTTTVAAWLAQHPDVFMTPVKEPHYYASDLYTHVQNAGPSGYAELFKAATDRHRFVGEASTGYLFSEVAVERILHDSPDAKFIVCLRSPIEMAPALHMQRYNDGLENIADFRDAWEAHERRNEGVLPLPAGCPHPRLIDYRAFCSLGAQLERLVGRVPASRVNVILLEELRADPRSVYLDTLDFLGLERFEPDQFAARNPAFVRRSMLLHRSVRALYLYKRKLKLPRFGTGLMALENRLNRREAPRAPVTPTMQRDLIDYFSSDVNLLGTIIERDLSRWLQLPDGREG
jgi:hypothetical protein